MRFGFDALVVPLAAPEPAVPDDRLAVEERLAAVPVDLARLLVFFAPVDRLDFAPPDFRAVEREDDERVDPPVLPELALPELLPLLELSSSPVHLPDMTRCAASATASAISEPSRDALDTTLLAAC